MEALSAAIAAVGDELEVRRPHPGRALASLASRLGPAEAADAAGWLFDTLSKAHFPDPQWLDAFTALADRLTTEELVELLKQPTCVGGGRVAILKVLSRRIGPPAPPQTVAACITVALQPSPLASATGLAHAEALFPRGRRPFAELWEAVDWLHENRPDLDLSRPPRPAGAVR
jgi:hypothetical protein